MGLRHMTGLSLFNRHSIMICDSITDTLNCPGPALCAALASCVAVNAAICSGQASTGVTDEQLSMHALSQFTRSSSSWVLRVLPVVSIMAEGIPCWPLPDINRSVCHLGDVLWQESYHAVLHLITDVRQALIYVMSVELKCSASIQRLHLQSSSCRLQGLTLHARWQSPNRFFKAHSSRAASEAYAR